MKQLIALLESTDIEKFLDVVRKARSKYNLSWIQVQQIWETGLNVWRKKK